ncbi:hypothetical protein M413DRAFT_439545 [Hebeloma cylindrosporum]|uniref:Uncharacterized protein n=1 Tax=Hebeloma cylindrosporum TaxID=76867 RepID=A0A0C3CGI7_HEBCY|nr:hypothetical protein M413DRAFT_439545 [Hebeloma cylindrosporum h7]
MPSPPITLYMTTIASQPALRQRQEYIFRILQVKKIPFNTYDLASDEEAKRLWRRKAPQGKQQLPGILVGGKYPGTFEEFEDAVEHDELDIFLRLKEEWDPAIDEDRPPPAVKPVGIPGASSPLQMTPDRLKSKMFPSSPSPSPLKTKIVPVNKRADEIDLGDELSGYGLQGIKVTEDELRDLMAELGLEGDEAGDLVKGLSGVATPPEKDKSAEGSTDTTKQPAKEEASITKQADDKGPQVGEVLSKT